MNNLKLISEFNSKTSNLQYKNYFYKVSEKYNRNQYISHLIFNLEIKISNYNRLFALQENAIENLVQSNPEINSTNSLVYSFFDLKKGMAFVPDMKLLGEALNAKEHLEKKYNIFYAGGVGIIDFSLGRAAEMVYEIGDYYYFKNQAAVVKTFQDALKVIDSFDI